VPTQADKTIFSAEEPVTCTFSATEKNGKGGRRYRFTIADQEIVSLVGGSGCGKSVLAKSCSASSADIRGQFLYNGDDRNQRRIGAKCSRCFRTRFPCFNQFFTIRSQLEKLLWHFQRKALAKRNGRAR
jgi:peptide/nickel transport system ATP-binding protein